MDADELKKKVLNIQENTDIEPEVTDKKPNNIVNIQNRKTIKSNNKSADSATDIPSDIETNSVEEKHNDKQTDNDKITNSKTSHHNITKPKQHLGGEKRIEPDIKFDEDQKQSISKESTEEAESSATVEYSADPLPEQVQKKPKNEESVEVIQQPTIYDTKEFYLPIKESYHGHGSKKIAIIFGVIFAIIIVAIAIYYFASIK